MRHDSEVFDYQQNAQWGQKHLIFAIVIESQERETRERQGKDRATNDGLTYMNKIARERVGESQRGIERRYGAIQTI